MSIISLKDVWLKYRVEFKENGKLVPEDFWALEGVIMDVGIGESVAIIGENGAGKTTLLKLIAGMLKPDRGLIQVNGKVSGIMEIGSGFNRDLTGRENIYLISSLFGLTQKQIDDRYQDIVNFASIGRFINALVKTYSQGMYMRLAFAIAIHVNPDILLIDDMFAVGDLYAQHKCINKMFELREKGKTIIFVTHDLETAKRFCQKGIFLKDGRVVKEGNLKEIAFYYLETVGDKKGVGILQGASLGVVFNNGKLILNWGDNSITKDWGGHTYAVSSDNRYSSLQADWELKKSNRDSMVLEGRFWDLPISQSWEIKLDDVNNEIDLKIEMDVKEKCNLQECAMCFMFKEEYKYWFNPFHKKLFEVDCLDKEFSWKCINSETPAVNFIGLSDQDKPGALLPSVILEDNVSMFGKLLEIKNTDHTFKARVLQSKVTYCDKNNIYAETGKSLPFHIKIKVMTQSMESCFRQDTSKTMLPKIIGDKVNLSLAVDDMNMISLYWRNKKITASKGFKTKFCCNDKIYHSSDAIWNIHKVSNSRLDVIIQWAGLPIRQIWNIELLGSSAWSWKVYVEIFTKAVIKNSKFSIMFSPQYTEWITSSGDGEISEELNTEGFKDIIMRNDPLGILGLKSIGSKILEWPAILLHDASDRINFNSLEKKIDKNTNASGSFEPTVVLYLLNLDSKETIDFPAGSYLACDASILIGDDFQQKKCIEDIKKCEEQTAPFLKKKSSCFNETVIQNGQYKFSFTKGKGRLFFKDAEITKNFGIYTSLYSHEFNERGSWLTSLDAIWEIVYFKGKRFMVKGKWPFLPLTQIWEIKAENKGFVWKIDMEVFASTLIERQLSYLMLSDRYRCWSAPGGQSGFFPKEFSLLQWDSLYKEKGCDRLHIAIKDDDPIDVLPGLNFLCMQETSDFEAVVENSNTAFTSRILGFDKTICKNNEMIKPGLYKYFYGVISFK